MGVKAACTAGPSTAELLGRQTPPVNGDAAGLAFGKSQIVAIVQPCGGFSQTLFLRWSKRRHFCMAIGEETLPSVDAPDLGRWIHAEQVADFFRLTAADEDNARLPALEDLLDSLTHAGPRHSRIAVDVEGGEGAVVIEGKRRAWDGPSAARKKLGAAAATARATGRTCPEPEVERLRVVSGEGVLVMPFQSEEIWYRTPRVPCETGHRAMVMSRQ